MVEAASCPTPPAPWQPEDLDQAPPPCNQNVWKILRKVYRYAQNDGSTLQKIAYLCPAEGCEHECPDLAAVEEHVQTEHGVCLSAKKKKVAGSAVVPFSIERVLLPNGEHRVVCPKCIMQFMEEDRHGLSVHLAAEHGMICELKGQNDLVGQSEHLDMLYMAPSESWHPRREQALKSLRLVSLGSFCSMKISLQKLGFADSHLPFDWIRSSSDGVQHFVDNGFEDFFSVSSKCHIADKKMTMYRSQYHSFWHDDIVYTEAQQKLLRRIERFLALSNESRDLLFLRSSACTQEVKDAEALHAALQARFGSPGRRILLGLVIDGQDQLEGPFFSQENPNIVLVKQPFQNDGVSAGPCYCEAVSAIVDAALDPGAGAGAQPQEGFSAATQALCQWSMSVEADQGVVLGRGPERQKFDSNDMGLHSGFGTLMCFDEKGAKHVDCRGCGPPISASAAMCAGA